MIDDGEEGGGSAVKRMMYLATAALVAMQILVPNAFAQSTTERTTNVESTQPLPSSGGLTPSVLLPAAALLAGSGLLAYAVLRRR